MTKAKVQQVTPAAFAGAATGLAFSYPPKEASELGLMLAVLAPVYLVNFAVLGWMWRKLPGRRYFGFGRGDVVVPGCDRLRAWVVFDARFLRNGSEIASRSDHRVGIGFGPDRSPGEEWIASECGQVVAKRFRGAIGLAMTYPASRSAYAGESLRTKSRRSFRSPSADSAQWTCPFLRSFVRLPLEGRTALDRRRLDPCGRSDSELEQAARAAAGLRFAHFFSTAGSGADLASILASSSFHAFARSALPVASASLMRQSRVSRM
jgi:hypothetical protein